MKNRRLAAALVGGATLAAVVGGTTAASAAPARPAATNGACTTTTTQYQTTTKCTFTVSSTTVGAGGTITFTVQYVFTRDEGVTAYFESTPVVVGHFTADANGTVHGTVTVPANTPPGQHHLVLVGANGQTASTPITVVGSTATASSGSSGTLPFTGAEIAAMSTVGAALLIGGGVAFGTGMARKRRSNTPAA